MRRYALAVMLSALAAIVVVAEAHAQQRSSATGRGAVMGGLGGAAIGGIAGGGRGAAIGGAVGLGTGALIGNQMERRRGNYYWHDGRCWVRTRNNEFHPVGAQNCR